MAVSHSPIRGRFKGYLTVASDEHGRPVHLEIQVSRAGGVLRGLLDSLAVSVSLGLQRGVPLVAYVEQLALARFEPSGWTPGEIGYAHSIVDYVFCWLALKFPGPGAVDQPPEAPEGETCHVCGRPVTWDPGDIGLPAGLAASRQPAQPPAQ